MIPYDQLRVIDTPIPAERQSAKRHYGVHPYFTRRPYNVVRQYIQHYSREGDRVLDPFGGSGVTAIEAFLSNRIGIQNDINPLANFIAKGVADLSKGTLTDYTTALRNVCDRCEQRVLGLDDADNTAISRLLEQLPLPANVRLPANSDVQHYHDLFSPRQLAALAVIRDAIDDIPNRYARSAFRLAWSAALTRLTARSCQPQGVPNRGAVQASSVSIAIKLPRTDETSNGTVYGEYLLNRVVVEAWQSGALGSLNINRTDFADMVVRQGWSYDDKAHQWRHAGIMSVPLLGRL